MYNTFHYIHFLGAADVFQKYNIDFCCGGNRPLFQAINDQHLDEKIVIDELNTNYKGILANGNNYQDFSKYTPQELIDYIVYKHHGYLRRELPQIGKLTSKILQVHGARHQQLLSQVDKLFRNLKEELDLHLIKEEESVFPIISEYNDNFVENRKGNILKIVLELETEHENAGSILKELRRLTDDYTVPGDGCQTFQLTYGKLEELEKDLFNHIHLENNILFKALNN